MVFALQSTTSTLIDLR